MEFLNGIYKKEVTEWDELLGTSLLNQEVILEGAVHSIRNMGDVAFVILRRREGLFQTVVENEKANLSIHDLKEAMTLRVKGIPMRKNEHLMEEKSVFRRSRFFHHRRNQCRWQLINGN